MKPLPSAQKGRICSLQRVMECLTGCWGWFSVFVLHRIPAVFRSTLCLLNTLVFAVVRPWFSQQLQRDCTNGATNVIAPAEPGGYQPQSIMISLCWLLPSSCRHTGVLATAASASFAIGDYPSCLGSILVQLGFARQYLRHCQSKNEGIVNQKRIAKERLHEGLYFVRY